MWNELSEEDKEPYRQKQAALKTEYEDSMKEWREENPEDAKAEAKTKKGANKKEKKEGPKRANSAFLLFSNAARERVKKENPDSSFGDIGRILGAEWKAMSDADKEPYNKLAAEDKERYENEKKQWAVDHQN